MEEKAIGPRFLSANLHKELPASKTLATNDEAFEELVIDHSNNVEKKKF